MPYDDPARHRLRGKRTRHLYGRIVRLGRKMGNTRLANSPLLVVFAPREGMIQPESVIEMGTLDFARLVSNERGI